MTTLKLLLLGPPCFEVDGTSVEINRRKAIALLAYMAVTQQAYNRDVLATLLWPEAPRNRARAGLRQTLWELNKALGENWIESKGETLSLQQDAEIWVDVHNFQALLAACQTHGHPVDEICIDCLPAMTEIMNLYRDDFLAGFSLADSPGFDEWQYLEGESLRRIFAVTLEQLANYYLVREDFEAAILYIRRWLALDPLLDTPNLILMQLYTWTGQRSAAVRQYRKYVQLLDREMGFGPREDISALYQRIQRGEELPKVVTHGRGPQAINGNEAPPPKQALPDLPLGARDEIRLATVLVAGFSNASDTAWDVHPEQMAGATDTLFQIATEAVSKYEAQVDRFAGDSVQSVFGIQRLHEDDPERAIRAALEIQRLAQQHGLSLTVGISTGEVYLGPIKAAGSLAVTALGPVINMAARLQDKAKTGQIVVSAATHHHTQRAFKFAAFSVTIRGMLQPLTVYEVQQVLPRPEKMRGIDGLRSRLVGRADEYQKLKNTLENVLLGRGQMVSLIGEAGLGKSRLVEELKQLTLAIQNDEVPLIWLESRCLELRTATAYWPFIDLLRTYLYRQTGANSEVDRATALASALEGLVQNGDLQGGLARAEEIRMLLNNLLSLKVDAGWEEQLKTIGPEQIQYQTFFAVYDFLISLTRSQPLILVLEDLHWADDLSLDLVSLLMEAVPTTPLLLVCVYRPGYQHKGFRLSAIANRKCPEQYTEITLRELTPRQSQNMIESLLAVDMLPPGIENLALKQTGGNPFFMEEAIRVLIELGILYLDQEQSSPENKWLIRSDVDLTIAVPESVQSIILSRVDRLAPELKQTLRGAAVIGYNFQSWILAQLLPPSIDLAQTLWSLEETALIYRERVVPDEEYTFKHALIQESVYRTIPPKERATLHQQAGEALERRNHPNLSEWHDQLAYHYSRSEMTEKAVEYLCLAGEKSRRAYLNEQAIRYFKQALKQLPMITADSSSQPTLNRWHLAALTGLGQTYHRLGKETRAQDYLRQAIAFGQEMEVDRPTLIRLYHELGEVLHWQGLYEEQAELGQAGLALLSEEESESVEAALMNEAISISRFKQGNLAEFYALTAKTAEFIQKLPYLEELRPAYFHIVFSLYYQKRVTEAAEWLHKVENWAAQYNDRRTLAEVNDFKWGYVFQSGDFSGAISQADQVLAMYRKVGHNRRLWRIMKDMVWICLTIGDFSSAEKYAGQALELIEAKRLDTYWAESHLNFGLVMLCQKSWDKAAEALHQVSKSTLNNNFLWTEWVTHYYLGQVYRHQGQYEAAWSEFQTAMELFQTFNTPPVRWLNRWLLFTCLLSGLEMMDQVIPGETDRFKALCRNFESLKQLQSMLPLPGQWYLEPVEATGRQPVSASPNVSDSFTQVLDPDWTWHDPFADCAFNVQDGLAIHAVNGRDLWHLNLSAPRLLRTVAGDFAVQTVCHAVEPEGSHGQKPAIGGLLLWQDKQNFLRLIWGSRGHQEVSFEGCINNENIIVGRGLLPANSSQGPTGAPVYLRLVRQYNQVQALCSQNGEQWFSAGQIDFPSSTSTEVGLHAAGWIDRTIYPGAYPNGTAIRFQSFELWNL